MKKQIHLSLVLSSVLLASLTGCKKEATLARCQKNGADASYAAGVSLANSENAAEEARGYAAGQALTPAQGTAAGEAVAYNNGYNGPNGYNAGYNSALGYNAGYAQGWASTTAATNGSINGAAQGKIDGTYDGREDGEDDGYYDGFLQGYADGYDDGYVDGYYDGSIYAYNNPETCPGYSGKGTGSAPAVQKSMTTTGRDWANECEEAGYNATIHLQTSYNTGYNNGKAANAPYQAAYAAGVNNVAVYNQGAQAGYAAGQTKGYNDGYDKGYHDRYTSSYNAAYTPAYNSWYNYQYNISYNDYWYYGYDDGYYDSGEGYDDGYDDGYVDGFDDQCYIMGYKTSGNRSTTEQQAKETSYKSVKELSFTVKNSSDTIAAKAKASARGRRAQNKEFRNVKISLGLGKPVNVVNGTPVLDYAKKPNLVVKATRPATAEQPALEFTLELKRKLNTAEVSKRRSEKGAQALSRNIGENFRGNWSKLGNPNDQAQKPRPSYRADPAAPHGDGFIGGKAYLFDKRVSTPVTPYIPADLATKR